MIRQAKPKAEAASSNSFLTRADKLYDARKKMRDSLFLDMRTVPETAAEWIENRYREKEPTNIYDSME